MRWVFVSLMLILAGCSGSEQQCPECARASELAEAMSDATVVVYAQTLVVTDSVVVIEPLETLRGALPVEADGTFEVRGYTPAPLAVGWWMFDADLRPLAASTLGGGGPFPLARDDISVAGAVDQAFEDEVIAEVARLMEVSDAIAVLEPAGPVFGGSLTAGVVMVVAGSGMEAGERITVELQPGYMAEQVTRDKSVWALERTASGWKVVESWLYMPWACGSRAEAEIGEHYFTINVPSNDVTRATCGRI